MMVYEMKSIHYCDKTVFFLQLIDSVHLLCVWWLCVRSVLTGLSLIMRAGSVNTSALTEALFVPVFSVGGGEAF